MNEFLKNLIPKPIRPGVRRVYHRSVRCVQFIVQGIIDLIPARVEVIRGENDQLIPPERLNFVGKGDFVGIGKEFFKYFVKYGCLQPQERVLEVGCGIGRMAIPLMDYLTTGTYDGFDIVPVGIRWCKKNITRRKANFRFQLANIINTCYNPGGRVAASDYVFPYAGSSFDFVFLTSVFTHMLPQDMEHYFAEISRVLKPGGRCLITFFLLDKESLAMMKIERKEIHFDYQEEGYRVMEKENPEIAVGYPIDYIRSLHEKNRLVITEPILYGYWSGRKDPVSLQDMVISVKE